MTWNWRPELGRYRDHAANAAETPPFISAACPFLRHQTKITRLFEVSSCLCDAGLGMTAMSRSASFAAMCDKRVFSVTRNL